MTAQSSGPVASGLAGLRFPAAFFWGPERVAERLFALFAEVTLESPGSGMATRSRSIQASIVEEAERAREMEA